MSEAVRRILWLHDGTLTPYAVSAFPAWAWSVDATQIIWANPPGVAIFGARSPSELAARQFDGAEPAAAQIGELAGSLLPHGEPRIAHLRGFGAGIGRALTCYCARTTLADGTPAILVTATERAGPTIPLIERVARLFAGIEDPIAAFTPEEGLLYATPAAVAQLGGQTLAEIGAEPLAAEARANGLAVGHTAAGPLTLVRAGTEGVLIGIFDEALAQLAPEPVLTEEHAPTDGPAAQETPAPEPPVLAPAVETPLPPPPTCEQAPPPARRHPLRFVWQIDAEGRFSIDSPEYVRLTGPHTAAVLGQAWDAVAATLGLDPEGQFARAINTHDTFSGLVIDWPVGGEPLPVELSGLPVFDRERAFRGYRGFGVCRALERLHALAEWRRGGARPAAQTPESVQAAPVRAEPSPQPAKPPPGNGQPPAADEPEFPGLSPIERNAFQELARRLANRINPADDAMGDPTLTDIVAATMRAPDAQSESASQFELFDAGPEPDTTHIVGPILDRFPVGILVYRLNHLLYANRAFLHWTGYGTVEALADAGGLDSLFVEPGATAFEAGSDKVFALSSNRGEPTPVEGRLVLIPWEGDSAFALITTPAGAGADADPAASLKAAQGTIGELSAILDTATDGVVVLDGEARIATCNKSAQALFGYDAQALEDQSFIDLFAPESIDTAFDYLEGLRDRGVESLRPDGREVTARDRQGGLIPLFMTLGRLGEDKFCAVFRDLSPWKKAEEDLIAARRAAEKQSAAKSAFLAKVSHDIRDPLNAIIGFSEVMVQERFGPVANERYREYLKDIHGSGLHLVSLVNDLLDLSKIEAGKLDLSFTGVALNDLVTECVALMQPQAIRERIIVRTSLAPRLPQVVADARSLKQIVLNLLSNSIKFTAAGGQVVISTALTESGEVALHVRDTGIGMSEADIAIALEPFRQVATRPRTGGTGLGLPLTRALAEANRASFKISSRPMEGTLVEVAFPETRVMAG